jgi:hypothetical protein
MMKTKTLLILIGFSCLRLCIARYICAPDSVSICHRDLNVCNYRDSGCLDTHARCFYSHSSIDIHSSSWHTDYLH